MVIELARLVEHAQTDIGNLGKGVAHVAAAERGLIQGVEGLGHIQAVQPDLIGIDGFVPEVSLKGARLLPDLPIEILRGLFILFLPRLCVQGEEHTPLVDIVKIVFFAVVGADRAVVQHEPVDKALRKVEVTRVPGDIAHGKQGGNHAAVDVVPACWFPFPDSLDVPGRVRRRGFFDQAPDVGVNFFVHTQSSQKFFFSSSS